MANPEHVAKVNEGVEKWNSWYMGSGLWTQAAGGADLSGADLHNMRLYGAKLARANLRDANLSKANLGGAHITDANLSGANLYGANLVAASLISTNLSGADLREANLRVADLGSANLDRADLREANLQRANLVGTNLSRANLTGCNIYGISVWDVQLEGTIQSNLVITQDGQSPIQVDNLEVAQFVYLLLNNERIRNVIDTITSKVVLILGRFTEERKAVLDAIREELRRRDYTPILFDFQKPDSKDLTGTIITLANMARFVIADLTDPGSVPYELATIIPGTVVPIQPILLEGQSEFAMFHDLQTRYHWVLDPCTYSSAHNAVADLDKIIAPAEDKARQLRIK